MRPSSSWSNVGPCSKQSPQIRIRPTQTPIPRTHLMIRRATHQAPWTLEGTIVGVAEVLHLLDVVDIPLLRTRERRRRVGDVTSRRLLVVRRRPSPSPPPRPRYRSRSRSLRRDSRQMSVSPPPKSSNYGRRETEGRRRPSPSPPPGRMPPADSHDQYQRRRY
ncbi:hypothetical protein ARMSODRAFT_583777 [Armillaria solidipes]|uniref:Uncharacterized protein n=1 Tax=Armillaria solidipes TaxID=1076256 RepID=A0A2H3CG86_9AGAR|nr:hypothetical protein ARMSODRAFT_583777 [Armillaria solidipes]